MDQPTLDPEFVQNWPIILNRMGNGLPAALRSSAVPRWSHRDPVEGGNPYPRGAPEWAVWETGTAAARDRLRRMDARIARTAQVTLDPALYRAQLLDLAVGRFDIWTERGLTVVSTEQTRRDYEHWLAAYVTNWLRYVADTCPRVDAAAELRVRLRERTTKRALQAHRRVAP